MRRPKINRWSLAGATIGLTMAFAAIEHQRLAGQELALRPIRPSPAAAREWGLENAASLFDVALRAFPGASVTIRELPGGVGLSLVIRYATDPDSMPTAPDSLRDSARRLAEAIGGGPMLDEAILALRGSGSADQATQALVAIFGDAPGLGPAALALNAALADAGPLGSHPPGDRPRLLADALAGLR